MADLDFMVYKRIVLKSDQEPSIVALCDAINTGWHPPKGESKRNGEVGRAVQSVHGLARTLEDFLEQHSGITLECVLTFSYFFTKVSRTTVTQPTFV